MPFHKGHDFPVHSNLVCHFFNLVTFISKDGEIDGLPTLFHIKDQLFRFIHGGTGIIATVEHEYRSLDFMGMIERHDLFKKIGI